jgi:hypothetical protein
MPRCHRASDVRRAIERKLNPSDFRGCKELNYWLELDGKKVTRVTVTKSNDELRAGTQASIRNQLRLSREQFDDLVICPMSRSEYYELLRKKIRLGLL